MTTPRWEAGKLYPPGSLVRPVSSAASTVTTIPNADFEGGNTDWSFSGGAAYSASGGFSGPACARITGSNGSVFLTAGIAVTPGQSITASCMGSMPAGSAGTSFDCKLVWYDSSDVLISTTEGTELRRSEGSGWRKSTTTGVAPAGAAFVRIGADGNVATGGDIYIDDFAWDYLPSSTPGGLIYKAVQAEVGASGSEEPTWPTVLGNTVVDNEVTWEAVQANQVVWVATPLMKSGPTEPSWPTEVGASVIDNTIRWEAISRRVTDENCPNTEAVVIMASKVFAGDEDIVRFSATANPLDWTSEQDAGYLPTGLQQANANSVAVLAPYRANLAVFNAACFQAWQADPDPAVMAILDQMDGIGSTWPRAAVAVGDELFFLSALGVRTVSISGGNESLTAGDVGMPVDPLIQEAIATTEADGGDALGSYYPALGQYLLVMPDPVLGLFGDAPNGTVGEAYSFSYSATGGTAPYVFSIASGSLPDGLSMDSDGNITGTPTTTGTFNWRVRVEDADGLAGESDDSAGIGYAAAWFYGPVAQNGASGGAETFYQKASTVDELHSSTPIALPPGMVALLRISVAGGAVFFHGSSASYVSFDNGQNWNSTNENLNYNYPVFWDGTYFWCGLRRSVDGKIWGAPPSLPADAVAVMMARDNDGVVVMGGLKDINVSTDGGATWTLKRTSPWSVALVKAATNGTRVWWTEDSVRGFLSDDLFVTPQTHSVGGNAVYQPFYGGGVVLVKANPNVIGRTEEDQALGQIVTSVGPTDREDQNIAYGDGVWAVESFKASGPPRQYEIKKSTDTGLTWTTITGTLYGNGGNLVYAPFTIPPSP